jgi:hypothetical protein
MARYNATMTNKTRKRAPGGGRKPKGPISKNAGWLQARITEDLRARLEDAAERNGHSMSQEAQIRLKESFDLPAELQKLWGPPHIQALARLVARVVRSVETMAGADPFGTEAGEFAWHRNAYTHAMVSAAIAVILARYKPDGPVQVPEQVIKSTEWIVQESGEEQAERQRTPESMGLSCALGLLNQMASMREPPPHSLNAHYAESYYRLPNINKILGEPKK